MTAIEPAIFPFLHELKENNNRDWFATNKPRYQSIYNNFKAFATSVENQMSLHDEVEPVKVYRIYRDVRFSKNKTPYKINFSGSFTRSTALKRGGYYFHVEAGNSFAGGGFWGPNSADLKRIRQDLAADPDSFRSVIQDKAFIDTFANLRGDQLKTAPKGYPKDHPAIDLLRYKQFLLLHEFTDEEVLAPNFAERVSDVFRAMRPFLNHMTDILTTDANGVPIV